MAKVINAADTNRLDTDPLAAGFEAIAVGYSLRFPDDTENIERQFEVYDSLYAWCRLDATTEAAPEERQSPRPLGRKLGQQFISRSQAKPNPLIPSDTKSDTVQKGRKPVAG